MGMTKRQEKASGKAKSREHYKKLLDEPGNYQQPKPSEAYKEGWERIFGDTDNKEEEDE